jgi:L-ascorbate metabolism protein UlaG (beta-lactamase superfamily)
MQPRDRQGRFINLDGSGPHSANEVLRWAVLDKIAGRRRKSADGAGAPVVRPDRALLSSAATRPRITWLGHASFLVQVDGASIVIDPIFPERIGGFIKRKVAAPLQPAELPRIDATLVSHNHYDHLDQPSVRALGAPVFAGSGMGSLVERCREMEWWEVAPITTRVRVHFVPSKHWSRRSLRDVNRTLWGGFVIEGESGSVYHAGDTAFFDGFAEIGRRFPGISAALLPIGAYDPGWFMEMQHMNPEQAVRGFVDLGARTFVAMHWGTFKLTDEPLDEPPARLRAEWSRRGLAPDRLRIPAVGETVEA